MGAVDPAAQKKCAGHMVITLSTPKKPAGHMVQAVVPAESAKVLVKQAGQAPMTSNVPEKVPAPHSVDATPY